MKPRSMPEALRYIEQLESELRQAKGLREDERYRRIRAEQRLIDYQRAMSA